ncbi:MAG: hypothetical protein IJ683_06730 [Butyrivibrio sp.]|nr:hypothetical protein [Butyrivibrio sp.]MBR1641997.1 hypothetical protein [Butyrivibrio sp.]
MDDNKKKSYIIIGVCCIAALIAGFLVGKPMADKGKIDKAKEYLAWESENHTWVEATCEHPKTCSVCGITEGELADHTWQEASCQQPKTCSVCGITEGEKADHDWKMATLDEPKKCKVCGTTEGDPIKLTTYDLSFAKDSTRNAVFEDSIIRVTDEEQLQRTNPNARMSSVYTVVECFLQRYDYDGKEIGDKVAVGKANYDNYFGFSWWASNLSGEKYFIFMLGGAEKDKSRFYVYDDKLNLIDSILTGFISNPGELDDSTAIVFFDPLGPDENYYVFSKDDKKLRQTDKNDSVVERVFKSSSTDFPFDADKYKNAYAVEAIDGFRALSYSDDDRTKWQWTFFDKDGKEIVTYRDASDCNKDGYAFVTQDDLLKSFDLIDKDFNVVAENVISVPDGCVGDGGVGYNALDDLFYISYKDKDGNSGNIFYRIE